MDPARTDAQRAGDQIARGAAWMVAMRWLMRGVGLVNTIVLARLLAPEDFGVLAMSAVIVELLMMLSDTGMDIAIIRDNRRDRAIYDSAWTLQAGGGLLVAGLVVALAAPLAAYYDDPRVELVMYILALRPAILGFENVAVAEFRKSFDYAKEFRYFIFRRLALFVFSLALALTLQNYLALAIAAPLSALVAVIFSFVMSTYRPRICFSHAAQLWGMSRWLILQNVAQSALDRSDELIIGGATNATMVGHYYIASQVAPMPTREIAWPVERALMPAYARMVDDPVELRRSVVSVMGMMGVICISTGLGLMATAEDLVLTVFGDAWRPAVPLFEWLAVFGILAGLGRPFMPLFYAQGRERAYALLCTVQVLVTVPAVIYAAYRLDLVAVAQARTGVAALFFAVFCIWVTRVSAVQLRDFVAVLWRPALAGAAMVYAVKALHDPSIGVHALSLARDVSVGAAVFATSLTALWLAAGRPAGAEETLLRRLQSLVARPRAI